jgi:hypothetical protein
VQYHNGAADGNAVSRKAHGSAGRFDVGLPLAGTPGIECRSGGATNDYQIVITFGGPVTFSTARVTQGIGSVSSTSTNGDQVFVNLTGVTNAQTIQLTLLAVNGRHGDKQYNDPHVRAVGRITANKAVSNTDVAAVKAQVAAPVTASNFRNDVNANGVVSNTDVSSTKAQVGT